MSETFPIRISDVVAADDRTELQDRLDAFNFASTGFRDARDLSCFLRDAEGTLVAGIDGFTWGGYAQSSCSGSQSRSAARASGGGCSKRRRRKPESAAALPSSSRRMSSRHQVFYAKLGYRTVGVTEDTPVGYREFHFQKRLAAAGKV